MTHEPEVEEVILDFELAMWEAVRETLPAVHLHGCMFHWAQAIYRQMSQLGLQTAYREHGTVHSVMKKLLALPYLPRRHIPEAFQNIREQAEPSQQLTDLMSYVDVTWMKSTTWAIGNWSSYRRPIHTNNDTEGWHRRLNTRASQDNLSMYLLIPLLHKEATMVNIQFQLVAQHKSSSLKRKTSKDHQEQLSKLWTEYEEHVITTAQFLTGCINLVPF